MLGSTSIVSPELQAEIMAMGERNKQLEAALEDAYPFVCIFIAEYAREHGLSHLHETHARIADNIATLLGNTRLPSKVLTI